MKIFSFLFSTLSFVLSGCLGNGGEYCKSVSTEASLTVKNNFSVKTFDVVHSNLSSMWEEIDSVCVIPLENSEKSVFGKIDNLVISNDTIYVVDMFGTKSVKMFDLEGLYLGTIGRIGHGPGEYIQVNDVQFYDGFVDVLDCLRSKVVRYNKHGECIKEIMLKTNPSKYIEISPNSAMKVYQYYTEEHPFRLEFVDSMQNIVNTALPFTNTRDLRCGQVTKKGNDNYLFYYPLCDTIFCVNSKGITVKCRCAIYSEGEVENFFASTSNLSLKEFLIEMNSFNKNIRKNLFFYESDTRYYTIHRYGSDIYHSIIDKKTKEVKTSICENLSRNDNQFPFFVYDVRDDCLVSFINKEVYNRMSNQSKRTMKELCDYKSQLCFEKLESSKEEDGSFICLFKIKEK